MTVGLEGRTIIYDGANRPKRVTWRGASTSYLYGPDGERVQKNAPGGTTLYLGDTEVTPQGRTIVHPHPDVRMVDGVRNFLHRDHLASVIQITDMSGAVITRRDFRPDGDGEGLEWVDPLTQPESKGLSGERLDPETGPHDCHAPTTPGSAAAPRVTGGTLPRGRRARGSGRQGRAPAPGVPPQGPGGPRPCPRSGRMRGRHRPPDLW